MREHTQKIPIAEMCMLRRMYNMRRRGKIRNEI